VLLPVFMGCHPVPQPNWGYAVAKRDLRRLQPLCEVIQQLLRGGLLGADLLWTFFSRRVQPLCRWVMTMCMYLEPSCPDRRFFEELSNVEINTWIHMDLAPGANSNLGAGPTPLREGVDSTWVSPLGPILDCLCQL
jgi:hypothetical protein